MVESDILRELFDDKMVNILHLFIGNPEKQFYLTEVSTLSKVNMTSTFRILNKLAECGYLQVGVVGKVRIYKLHLNEKTKALSKILRKEESPLQEFISILSSGTRVKKIVLESSNKEGAKVLLVGDFLPREKIKKICEDIRIKNRFIISFAELSENQFKEMRTLGLYDLGKKIIWERKSE